MAKTMIGWNPAASLGHLGRTVLPWRYQVVLWLLIISGGTLPIGAGNGVPAETGTQNPTPPGMGRPAVTGAWLYSGE